MPQKNPRNEPTDWAPYFPVAADFERPGPVDLLRFVYSRPAGRALRKLISDHKPDIAHLHIYYGKLSGSILAPLKKAGIPVVQTLHEYKLICPTYSLVSNGRICEACQGRHFWQAIPRRCNRNSSACTLLSVTESYVSRFLGSVNAIDHFIAVSDFLRQKMVEHGMPAEKISTIHNYIDSSGIEPSHRPGKYFLYFGRLEQLKGIFTLVEAGLVGLLFYIIFIAYLGINIYKNYKLCKNQQIKSLLYICLIVFIAWQVGSLTDNFISDTVFQFPSSTSKCNT